LWTLSSLTNRAAGFNLSDLNDLVSSSDWLLTSAQYVNRDGFIAGQGWHAATVIVDGAPAFQAPVPRVFLLVPNVSLAVDYNRDGRIELNERDDLPE
jgi:membrane-bound lytic murein transglycosylase B